MDKKRESGTLQPKVYDEVQKNLIEKVTCHPKIKSHLHDRFNYGLNVT